MTKPRILALGIGAAGLACLAAGLAAGGPLGWLGAWIALACGIAAVAYLTNRPELLGKRGGRLWSWRNLPVWPYLAAYATATAVRERRRRYALYDEVCPGVFVGARIAAERLPRGVRLVVDLTSEIAEPRDLRERPGYRCLPVLDGSVPPDEERFLELLEELTAASGAVYLHCISGRGRAPTAAAALLLARGVAADAATAFELVRKRRPATKLTRTDLRFVQRIATRLG